MPSRPCSLPVETRVWRSRKSVSRGRPSSMMRMRPPFSATKKRVSPPGIAIAMGWARPLAIISSPSAGVPLTGLQVGTSASGRPPASGKGMTSGRASTGPPPSALPPLPSLSQANATRRSSRRGERTPAKHSVDLQLEAGIGGDLEALLEDDEVDQVDAGQGGEAVLAARGLEGLVAAVEGRALGVLVAALKDEHALLAEVAVERKGRAGGELDEAAVRVRDARPAGEVDDHRR